MAEEKFAFESDEVSVSFVLNSGLGDAIIAKKVFEAIIELAPNCLVDIFCTTEALRTCAKAFYSFVKNFNRLLNQEEYSANLQRYDLSIIVFGFGFINLQGVNVPRLQAMAPKLFEAVVKIDEYNRNYIHRLAAMPLSITLRDSITAQILGKIVIIFCRVVAHYLLATMKLQFIFPPNSKRNSTT